MPELADTPKKLPPTKNIKDAAKFINCSEDELLRICIESKQFHAYIRTGKYPISNKGGFASNNESIEYHIERGDIDPLYDRPYDGLVRIRKEYGSLPKTTLKYIRDGGVIDIKRTDNVCLLPFQRSLGEGIKGTNYLMIVNENIKITKDDLVLIEDELKNHISSQVVGDGAVSQHNRGQSNEPKSLPINSEKREKDKQKRTHELRELIEKTYDSLSKKTEKLSNADVWAALRDPTSKREGNPLYDLDDIIQEITNTNISWISHCGNEQNMKRGTFNNYLAALRKN